MDIYRQVFVRSARMGVGYVIMGILIAVLFTTILNVAPRFANIPAGQGQPVDLTATLGFVVIPLVALSGLIITTPVYLLFVNDKNAGVLEYLLAVGMNQRDVFKGYLKAALLLSLVAMVPAAILNLVLSPSGLDTTLVGVGLSIATGAADVALVTVLMTGFSSMQSRPTGMNSPLGIGIGVIVIMPELLLFSVMGTAVLWVDMAVAVAIFAVAVLFLLSLDRLVSREKLLP